VNHREHQWLMVEDFAAVCIDPATGSIVRGKTPWYIWPDVHPTHLHIPSVCLIVLDLLASGQLIFDVDRLRAAPAAPSLPSSLLSAYCQVLSRHDGPVNSQLKAACWFKHGKLAAAERPLLYERANPWFLVLHDLASAGRLEYLARNGPSLRSPRVRFADRGRQEALLEDLRLSVNDGSFADELRTAALLVAMSAAHLELLLRVPDFHRHVLPKVLEASLLPAGVHHVFAFMRRASERMSTS
jgi:hypothetical protein